MYFSWYTIMRARPLNYQIKASKFHFKIYILWQYTLLYYILYYTILYWPMQDWAASVMQQDYKWEQTFCFDNKKPWKIYYANVRFTSECQTIISVPYRACCIHKIAAIFNRHDLKMLEKNTKLFSCFVLIPKINILS